MLLFVFAGVFLLRFADRQFLALLFHEPPRRTARPFLPARHLENGASDRSFFLNAYVFACEA